MLKSKTKPKAPYFPPTGRAAIMLNAPQGDYQSISVMDRGTGYGNKFFVEIAGTTNGAHRKIVSDIQKRGYVEVLSPEESDFLLIFCPVASRVGIDIGEALQNVQFPKPKLLVVMHHTFNDRQAVAESRRQVEDGNVFLTVDYLFYEGNILDCERNDNAWGQICNVLPIITVQLHRWEWLTNWCCRKKWQILVFAIVSVSVIIIISSLFHSGTKKPMNVSSKYSLK